MFINLNKLLGSNFIPQFFRFASDLYLQFTSSQNILTDVSEAYHEDGNVTIGVEVKLGENPTGAQIGLIGCQITGESYETNTLYQISLTNENELYWIHEYGVGLNEYLYSGYKLLTGVNYKISATRDTTAKTITFNVDGSNVAVVPYVNQAEKAVSGNLQIIEVGSIVGAYGLLGYLKNVYVINSDGNYVFDTIATEKGTSAIPGATVTPINTMYDSILEGYTSNPEPDFFGVATDEESSVPATVFDFDGISQKIVTGFSGSAMAISGSFNCSMLVKTSALGDRLIFISNYSDDASNGFAFEMSATGYLRFYLTGSTSLKIDKTTSTTFIADGKWHFIEVNYDNTDIVVKVDEAVQTMTGTHTLTSGTIFGVYDLEIGSDPRASALYAPCQIANVQFARSDGEGFLYDGLTNAPIDRSGNGNDATSSTATLVPMAQTITTEVFALTGTGTQYIDTDISPMPLFNYELDVKINGGSSTTLMGGSENPVNFNIARYNATLSDFEIFIGGTGSVVEKLANSDFLRHTWYKDGTTAGIVGYAAVTIPEIDIVTSTPAYLFARNVAQSPNYYMQATIYGYKCWEDTTLLADMIAVPLGWKAEEGVPMATSNCMWCKVRKQYFENEGTGTFSIAEV